MQLPVKCSPHLFTLRSFISRPQIENELKIGRQMQQQKLLEAVNVPQKSCHHPITINRERRNLYQVSGELLALCSQVCFTENSPKQYPCKKSQYYNERAKIFQNPQIYTFDKWYIEEMIKIYTNQELLYDCFSVTFGLLSLPYTSPVIDLRSHIKLQQLTLQDIFTD